MRGLSGRVQDNIVDERRGQNEGNDQADQEFQQQHNDDRHYQVRYGHAKLQF